MARFQSPKLKQEVVLRDPVHGYIHIEDKVVLDVVKSKEFQRMRRIKQLGPVSYVFPGATHTRFEHNLGVYELTRRICDIFTKKYPSTSPDDGLWNDDNRLLVECAGLLHDIGHGLIRILSSICLALIMKKSGKKLLLILIQKLIRH